MEVGYIGEAVESDGYCWLIGLRAIFNFGFYSIMG
jgi:hypothetical protein